MIFRRTERRSPWYNAVIGEILSHIIWRLQVSRQHPSADVDNLVNEIFEILMEMETKGIDPSSFELYFDKHWQLHNLRALPPEVSAERLRTFMSTLQKRMESDNIALIAAAAELAAEDGADARDALQDRFCTMREETKTKCDGLRAFGLDYIRSSLTAANTSNTAGGPALTARHVSKAYAESTGIDARTVVWIFKMRYVDFDSLIIGPHAGSRDRR